MDVGDKELKGVIDIVIYLILLFYRKRTLSVSLNIKDFLSFVSLLPAMTRSVDRDAWPVTYSNLLIDFMTSDGFDLLWVTDEHGIDVIKRSFNKEHGSVEQKYRSRPCLQVPASLCANKRPTFSTLPMMSPKAVPSQLLSVPMSGTNFHLIESSD